MSVESEITKEKYLYHLEAIAEGINRYLFEIAHNKPVFSRSVIDAYDAVKDNVINKLDIGIESIHRVDAPSDCAREFEYLIFNKLGQINLSEVLFKSEGAAVLDSDYQDACEAAVKDVYCYLTRYFESHFVFDSQGRRFSFKRLD